MGELQTSLQDDSAPARKRSRTEGSIAAAGNGDLSDVEEDDDEWEEAILGAVGDMPQLELGNHCPLALDRVCLQSLKAACI